MRTRLSQKLIIVINVVVIIIFVTGLCLNYFNLHKWLGIVCQIISLLYTVIFGFLSLRPYTEMQDNPTPYFTDRREALDYAVEQLFEITCNHSQEQIIAIKYDGTEGIGKTELLRKLRQLLTCKSIAKEYFSPAIYEKCKKMRSKLGVVHFVSYVDDHTLANINQLPYVLFRKNIVLIDDLPSLPNNPFQKEFVIVYCQPVKQDNKSQIKLQKFSSEDIKTMYRSKFQEEIDPVFLQQILDYTQGNVAQISNIFKSRDVCDVFQHETYTLYLLYSYIDNGEYSTAQKLLTSLTENRDYLLSQDEDYQYRLNFIKYDLLHFDNKYQQALDGFEILMATSAQTSDRYYKILERICHIKSHLGRFQEALGNADRLPLSQKRKSKLVLSLLAYIMYGKDDYYQQAKNAFYEMEKCQQEYITPTKDSYHTYQAVLLTYTYKFDSAHRAINKAIACYENIGSKFLTNCYFIKAEIYRHEGAHDQACEYYQKCLNTYRLNGDYDIYSLVVSLLLYEINIHNAKHNFDQDSDLESIKEQCIHLGMDFNKKVVMCLDELLKLKAELPQHKKEYEQLQKFFKNYVFFIP